MKVMQKIEQQQSLGHLTGLASRLFNRLLTQRFKQAGIDMTAEQWGVIVVLSGSEALTQSQICELLYLEKSSVSRSVDGLERRGWIVRKRAPHDSRSKLVELTEQSHEAVEKCTQIARSVLDDAQKGVDSEVLVDSKRQLSQVISNLRTLNH
ncbi:MarR family winged helix-turn-helix transcriptional regulator [Photobacterium rosenbergii]|uniref:MarR family transcriptional regulator n=1 Tax=Photobacterium rosenbergii TaxID=294936 RepID=A0ABU3ZNC1_9GAMM|nr:MarR family transcriptional regulator [Photobacterium rosenbergii]MDV5171592.1 MarR family transcriptional regulator [Photobacterium rosenbergii]